ncbi:MAG: YlxR family protein [Nocardioidaceae bacterium]
MSTRSLDIVRTCVGCRQRATRKELLRVVAGEQGAGLRLVPDPAARAPGRGAHLHPTAECLELALRRRAFGRALRVQGALDSAELEEFLRDLHEHGGPQQR